MVGSMDLVMLCSIPPNGITFDSSNGGAWIPAILSMEEKLIGRKNTLKKCRI